MDKIKKLAEIPFKMLPLSLTQEITLKNIAKIEVLHK